MKIYKYQFDIPILTNEIKISLPISAIVLSFQVQNNIPTIWVFIPENEKYISERSFFLVGTGHDFYMEPGIDFEFVGTIQLNGCVWHLFEIILEKDHAIN